jgi:uncharacterized membrane protein/YHS domain-containing protein
VSGLIVVLIVFPSMLHAQSVADPPPLQEACPVAADESIDPEISIRFRGEQIFFCCERCEVGFWADPEQYLSNLPQFGGEPAGSTQQIGAQPRGADDSHDHGDHAREAAGRREWIAFAGRFHVVSIHFPIALLVVAALFELVAVFKRSESLETTGRALVHLGAAASVVAVLLGLAHSVGAEYEGTPASIFLWHRAMGFVTTTAALLAAAFVEWRHRSLARGPAVLVPAVVIVTAVCVGVTGHLGGSLVYGWSFLVP